MEKVQGKIILVYKSIKNSVRIIIWSVICRMVFKTLVYVFMVTAVLSQALEWRQSNDGQVSWAVGCEWHCYCYQLDVLVNTTNMECGSLCLDNPQCNYYIWANDDQYDGLCVLDNSIITLRAYENTKGQICGYVNTRANISNPPQ